jgi:hypothetical protein
LRSPWARDIEHGAQCEHIRATWPDPVRRAEHAADAATAHGGKDLGVPFSVVVVMLVPQQLSDERRGQRGNPRYAVITLVVTVSVSVRHSVGCAVVGDAGFLCPVLTVAEQEMSDLVQNEMQLVKPTGV